LKSSRKANVKKLLNIESQEILPFIVLHTVDEVQRHVTSQPEPT
jgi:hypothetical protein